MTPTKFDRKSVAELLNRLELFRDYGGMRYRIEVGEYTGKDWLKISLGCSEKGKEVFITTDRIHCSEDTGTAESDAELITILLNAFCDGTIPNALLDNSLSERPMMRGEIAKVIYNTIYADKKPKQEISARLECLALARALSREFGMRGKEGEILEKIKYILTQPIDRISHFTLEDYGEIRQKILDIIEDTATHREE
jgi:hypothetical protein